MDCSDLKSISPKEVHQVVKAGMHSCWVGSPVSSPHGLSSVVSVVFKTWQLGSSRMMSDEGLGVERGWQRAEMAAAVLYHLTSSLVLYVIAHNN